jgi:hypothetical protein
LRVLSGRLRAVLVAILATTILVGVGGPEIARASDPPGLARFMAAVGQVESGGDYYARNASSGAYGKYQIIPSSWRAWAYRSLGSSDAKPTPANQDFVAAAKFRALYSGLGSWRRVAYWWLTGSSRTYGWSPYATRYVNRVMGSYDSSTAVAITAVANPLHWYQESSAGITYTGSWRSASYSRYSGGAAKYATNTGARATFAFTGTRVIWYGPVGPTRGQARIRIDGAYVRTVDLFASSFTARQAVFSMSWTTAAPHTLVIEVVGTAGHPYVAIDQLAVAN